jgi:hypothetical protein
VLSRGSSTGAQPGSLITLRDASSTHFLTVMRPQAASYSVDQPLTGGQLRFVVDSLGKESGAVAVLNAGQAREQQGRLWIWVEYMGDLRAVMPALPLENFQVWAFFSATGGQLINVNCATVVPRDETPSAAEVRRARIGGECGAMVRQLTVAVPPVSTPAAPPTRTPGASSASTTPDTAQADEPRIVLAPETPSLYPSDGEQFRLELINAGKVHVSNVQVKAWYGIAHKDPSEPGIRWWHDAPTQFSSPLLSAQSTWSFQLSVLSPQQDGAKRPAGFRGSAFVYLDVRFRRTSDARLFTLSRIFVVSRTPLALLDLKTFFRPEIKWLDGQLTREELLTQLAPYLAQLD